VGGYHCTEYLQKILQVNYPQHKNQITWERAQTIKENLCYVALDFVEELKILENPISPEAKAKTAIIQLETPKEVQTTAPTVSEEKEKEKELRKMQNRERLKLLAQNRKQKKVKQFLLLPLLSSTSYSLSPQKEEREAQLYELEELKKLKTTNPGQFLKRLELVSLDSEQQLDEAIKRLKEKLEGKPAEKREV
jgi:hypothetical protein